MQVFLRTSVGFPLTIHGPLNNPEHGNREREQRERAWKGLTHSLRKPLPSHRGHSVCLTEGYHGHGVPGATQRFGTPLSRRTSSPLRRLSLRTPELRRASSGGSTVIFQPQFSHFHPTLDFLRCNFWQAESNPTISFCMFSLNIRAFHGRILCLLHLLWPSLSSPRLGRGALNATMCLPRTVTGCHRLYGCVHPKLTC